MNFVFLNQFYPPEVLPTGVVLEAVAEALVSNGHHVTVLCGKSSVTGEGAHAPPGDAALEMGKWGNGEI